jgi:hypothetical protein
VQWVLYSHGQKWHPAKSLHLLHMQIQPLVSQLVVLEWLVTNSVLNSSVPRYRELQAISLITTFLTDGSTYTGQ